MEEKIVKGGSGMTALLVIVFGQVATLILAILCAVGMDQESQVGLFVGGFVLFVVLFSLLFLFYPGLKVIRPGEALVLTLFGRYYGTLRGAGFYFVNPFCVAVNPAFNKSLYMASLKKMAGSSSGEVQQETNSLIASGKKMSLKYMTLENGRQKINDELGNPIIIGIVVIWRIMDTAKAAFQVDNYLDFLSVQADSALRNIVRLYPYDLSSGDNDNEKTLRSSSMEIADRLRDEIQQKVAIAGIEVSEARITHLAYAPEIAAVMLQRQQASAIIDARQMIVDGAVGMVEMALDKLSERNVIELDEERKAAMVSNLLVVLCGSKDAQPVVNSGSLY